MATKPRQRPVIQSQQRPISITAVLDVVGVLASNNVHGHLYMYDTNKAGGSTGFGTEELRTRVRRGDQILWNVLALECEAYVAIDDIVVDREVIEPERKVYPGTDVAYWVGTVKKDDVDSLPYQLKFRVGTRDEPITATVASTLVG
ncbi:hypothetical protein [Streptomyces sp. NPDC050504]|uniref:hypothetical protein n=1 Tax=Streptomyces sp. NPDC050504 TaxID=3365618 RepID=UPI0037A3AD5D